MEDIKKEVEKVERKIGDEIFFMKYDEPKKGTIEGIATIEGKFQNGNFEVSASDGKLRHYSVVGGYSSIPENKAFSTREELIEDLFSNINK